MRIDYSWAINVYDTVLNCFLKWTISNCKLSRVKEGYFCKCLFLFFFWKKSYCWSGIVDFVKSSPKVYDTCPNKTLMRHLTKTLLLKWFRHNLFFFWNQHQRICTHPYLNFDVDFVAIIIIIELCISTGVEYIIQVLSININKNITRDVKIRILFQLIKWSNLVWINKLAKFIDMIFVCEYFIDVLKNLDTDTTPSFVLTTDSKKINS